jgi:hypothetical protein
MFKYVLHFKPDVGKTRSMKCPQTFFLGGCEFCENRCSENHTLLRG